MPCCTKPFSIFSFYFVKANKNTHWNVKVSPRTENASQATPHSLKSHVAHCQPLLFSAHCNRCSPSRCYWCGVPWLISKQTVNISEVILLHRSQKGAMHMYWEERWEKQELWQLFFTLLPVNILRKDWNLKGDINMTGFSSRWQDSKREITMEE